MNMPGSFVVWLTLLLIGPALAHAQFGGGGFPAGTVEGSPSEDLSWPVPHQVIQRGGNDRADVRIAPVEDGRSIAIRDASLTRMHEAMSSFGPGGMGGLSPGGPLGSLRFEDGAIQDVPVGGPYAVSVTYTVDEEPRSATIGPIFVGDLWVLAGQSNMQGLGDLKDVTSPHPKVMLFGMDRTWKQAEEPLHWLVDSPDPVHSGDPESRVERSKQQHENRTKGAGLGLPFAVRMVEATDVPVGLIAVAHGGTSMAQWDPSKKGEGGESLYGSMTLSVEAVGGRVRGVLWYQGESDANPEAAEVYPEVFADFIAAVRADFEQPELPFYLVQIGRFVADRDPEPWNRIQEAQRLLPSRVPFTGVVATVDLELDDLIHVGTSGLKRLGSQLAYRALHDLEGYAQGTTPTLDSVMRAPGNRLLLTFKGVNFVDGVGLRPPLKIAGFSIRDEDGTELPLIYDARVATSGDTVVLDLTSELPEGARLWYGYGLNPVCDLVDGLGMAVPAFGPIPLD